MTKDTFTEKISLWFDDQLSPAEVAELKDHLSGCPSCRQTYSAMQQVDQVLQAAARVMAAPQPGFTRRFETRLARQQPVKAWQLWLTVAALLLGTLFFFGAWLVVGSLTLVTVSSSLLDAGFVYQWLTTFIESIDTARVLLELASLLLKVGLIVVQQPVFWGLVLVAVVVSGIWMWMMQAVSRRVVSTMAFVL